MQVSQAIFIEKIHLPSKRAKVVAHMGSFMQAFLAQKLHVLLVHWMNENMVC